MKPTTREWVKKAENDFKVAAQILPAFPGAEAVARLEPNPQEFSPLSRRPVGPLPIRLSSLHSR